MTLCHGWSPTCGSRFKTWANCCGLFLLVKIHTALDQDKLILTKSQQRRFFFSFTDMLKQWEHFHGLYPLSPPPRLLDVCTVKPCMWGACQTKISSPRWTVILHKSINFSLIWNVLCAISKHMKADHVSHYITSKQKSRKQLRLGKVKGTHLCQTPSSLPPLNHWTLIFCRGPQTWALEEQTWNKQPFRHHLGCHGNIEKYIRV